MDLRNRILLLALTEGWSPAEISIWLRVSEKTVLKVLDWAELNEIRPPEVPLVPTPT